MASDERGINDELFSNEVGEKRWKIDRIKFDLFGGRKNFFCVRMKMCIVISIKAFNGQKTCLDAFDSFHVKARIWNHLTGSSC